ncbi:hypothetical protein P3T22_002632 [Paraburkholderia sp. GAS348]|jgi:hypothetical protein
MFGRHWFFMEHVAQSTWRDRDCCKDGQRIHPMAIALIAYSLIWSDTSRALPLARERVAKHRIPAGGVAARRFVLQHVPMLDELSVLDSHDIHTDQGG